jgi:hypothetical protein
MHVWSPLKILFIGNGAVPVRATMLQLRQAARIEAFDD